jgi:hypothetical protein
MRTAGLIVTRTLSALVPPLAADARQGDGCEPSTAAAQAPSPPNLPRPNVTLVPLADIQS